MGGGGKAWGGSRGCRQPYGREHDLLRVKAMLWTKPRAAWGQRGVRKAARRFVLSGGGGAPRGEAPQSTTTWLLEK